jgi:uncharacterized protein YndB with AHSA1/START domain
VGLIVCPTTVVAASATTVWRLLTEPAEYERWAGAELIRVTPPGPAQEGQVIEFRTRELGRWWHVRFDVGAVEPERSLELKVHLPFGVVNHEHVVLSPVDEERTRVTFN